MAYTIDKKIQYLIDELISRHLKENNPQWRKLILAYLQYLDQGSLGKVYSVTNNTDAALVDSDLLDDYLNNYFSDVIDTDHFGIDEQTKRYFLSLSKFITGLKGNKKSFDFLFKSLRNFEIPDPDGGDDITINEINLEYEENESWWEPGDFNWYNAAEIHDGSIDYYAEFSKPFTYRFTVSYTQATIIDLIKTVHPAGFFYEFLLKAYFDETVEISDGLLIGENKLIFYNQDETQYSYDGTAVHGPVLIEQNL
jgi:hypothetical protein